MSKHPYFFFGSLLSGIGGMVSSAQNYKAQKDTNALNKEMFEQNLAWQKQAYEQQRQDFASAHQTKVKDLEKAGLNKALALGGGAGVAASPALPSFQQQAPRLDNPTQGFQGLDGVAEQIASLITMKENIAQSKAQTDLIKAQVDRQKMETANISGDTKLKQQQTKNLLEQQYNTAQDTLQKQHNLETAKKQGRATTDSRSFFDQTLSVIDNAITQSIDGIKSFGKYKKKRR